MKNESCKLFKAAQLEEILIFKADYHRFSFKKHWHEHFALGVMDQGCQRFFCEGEDYCAQPGNLIVVNPGDVHDGKSADGKPYHYRILFLPLDLLKKISAEVVVKDGQFRLSGNVVNDKPLADQLHSLFWLLEDEKSEDIQVQSLFYSLLANLIKRHGSGLSLKESSEREVPKAISIGCEFINDMASESITLDDIAETAGMSRYHFLRVFNKVMGITPYVYLLQRRLHLAKDIMRKGTSLADVALDTGFTDQSHFTRAFKNSFGITPGQYQKAVL